MVPRHGDAALPGIDLKAEISAIRRSMLNLVDTCDDPTPTENRRFFFEKQPPDLGKPTKTPGGVIKVLAKSVVMLLMSVVS